MSDLDDIADALYAVLPSEFTAARDAAAAAARGEGNVDLAAAVKELRRPTTSAWLVNVLVRERPEQVEQLIDLGASLREAQSGMAGDELRRLSAQRQQLVAAVADEGRQLARSLGQPATDSTTREVAGTLDAALADPAAGRAVLSGRLTGALLYSGLGDVDLEAAVALPARSPASHRAEGRQPTRRPAQDRHAEKLRSAQAAHTESLQKKVAAEQLVAERDRSVKDVAERVEGLERQLEALEEQLIRVRRETQSAATALHDAEQELAVARRAHERAVARESAAAEAAAKLSKPT